MNRDYAVLCRSFHYHPLNAAELSALVNHHQTYDGRLESLVVPNELVESTLSRPVSYPPAIGRWTLPRISDSGLSRIGIANYWGGHTIHSVEYQSLLALLRDARDRSGLTQAVSVPNAIHGGELDFTSALVSWH